MRIKLFQYHSSTYLCKVSKEIAHRLTGMTRHAPTKIYMNPRRDYACVARRPTKYLMIYFQKYNGHYIRVFKPKQLLEL